MASTRTRSRMPDLSANLNENTSCSPLSDLWNFPQSKLFPANGQQQRAASPKVVATAPATTVATPESDSHSVTPIGQAPTDFKLGHAHSHGPAFPSTLWSRPNSTASSSPAGPAAAAAPTGMELNGGPNPEIVAGVGSYDAPPSAVASATAPIAVAPGPSVHAPTPVTGPVPTAAGTPGEPPSLLLAPQGGSPSTGSFRSQPRNGGIWGAEYPGFRHPHPSVSAFAQAPASTGRMVNAPFALNSGPVRALDQGPGPVATSAPPAAPTAQAVPSLPVGLAPSVSTSPAGPRSLDSSWDRTAFKQQQQHHHHVNHPHHQPTAATTAPAAAPTILSVHQQQQLHQQQQQQQQHRAQKKGGRPSTNTELYKTELCASYMSTGGNCPYGEKCQFAHGTQELKTVDRPPKWRSKPCQNWVKTGACSYNERCCFRHDVPVAPQ